MLTGVAVSFVQEEPFERSDPHDFSRAGARDGTVATRLPHQGGRTGLSRPLPGSYWFFPVGMPRLSTWAHDRNRRDSPGSIPAITDTS